MYESFFDLNRQPFLAAPDADLFAAIESVTEVRDALIRCIRSGQGIGALCAPPGTGKSMMCRVLIEALCEEYAIVLLPNSHFSTRRSLLQAILYEFGQSYAGLSEQELRLEMQTTFRSIRDRMAGVVLLIDEAHLLSSRLLEEVRTITNLVDRGRSLCSVILSGQLQLEERLAAPELSALNQRISCQVSLPQLTRMESAEYLLQRLAVAGADLSRVFTREAVQAICQASDGLPRCLNQLADQSLLRASLDQQKPVTRDHVLAALEDLKQLPLHWNEPVTLADPVEQLQREAARAHQKETADREHEFHRVTNERFQTADTDPVHDHETSSHGEPAAAAFEVGAGIESEPDADDHDAPVVTRQPSVSEAAEAPLARRTENTATELPGEVTGVGETGVIEIGTGLESAPHFEVGARLPESEPAIAPFDKEDQSLDAPSVLAEDMDPEADIVAEEPTDDLPESPEAPGYAGTDAIIETHSADEPDRTSRAKVPAASHSTDFPVDRHPDLHRGPAVAAELAGERVTAATEPAGARDRDGFTEQPVLDRYAIIDSGRSPEEFDDLPPAEAAPAVEYDPDEFSFLPEVHDSPLPFWHQKIETIDEPVPCPEPPVTTERRDPIGRIDQITPLLEAALSDCPEPEHHQPTLPDSSAEAAAPHACNDSAPQDLEEQIQAEVLDSCRTTRQAITERLEAGNPPDSGADRMTAGREEPPAAPPRKPNSEMPLTAFDIVHPEPEETRPEAEAPPAARIESETPVEDAPHQEPSADTTGDSEGSVQTPPGPRPLSHLFSSLRRRHRQS